MSETFVPHIFYLKVVSYLYYVFVYLRECAVDVYAHVLWRNPAHLLFGNIYLVSEFIITDLLFYLLSNKRLTFLSMFDARTKRT